MSFVSWLTNTTPQDEQEANLAKQKALFNQRLQQREAEGTIDPDYAASLQKYVDNTNLDSTDAAAAQGAAEGAIEIVTNPSQWLADTQTGATIVGTKVHDAYEASTSGLADKIKAGLLDLVKKFWPVLLILAIAAFFWAGGLPLLLKLTKGRLNR